MNTQTVTLDMETRKIGNKGTVRQLRRDGLVPAVIYGGNQASVNITVSHQALEKFFRTGKFMSTVVHLRENDTNIRVIARDLQRHPVRAHLLHADFMRLSKDATINVDIPVIFEGEEQCPGLRKGGVLNIVRHTIELRCKADSIPESLTVNLQDMELGDSVHISAVKLPEGSSPVISDRDFTVASIAAPAGLVSEHEETQGAQDEGSEQDGEEKQDDNKEGGEDTKQG